jgi:hypothetical protein
MYQKWGLGLKINPLATLPPEQQNGFLSLQPISLLPKPCRHALVATSKPVKARVARWYIFIPKISFWEYYGRPWNGKFCKTFCRLDIFIAIWHILWPIGMLCCHMGCFSTFWYVATLKIWQPR